MVLRTLTASLIVAVPLALAGAQLSRQMAPESFRANGQITGPAGGAAAGMVIQIDRYTADADHDALAAALRQGGHTGFVDALRKAPQIGQLTTGQHTFAIRWARTQELDRDHRRVAVVTDQPVFFAGAGAVDAKPTAGFDLAVIEFTIDSVGIGKGTMAPAARVKAGGPAGVQVDDYSGKRVELMTVTRNHS